LSLAELDQRLKAIESANGRYAPERKALPLDIDVLTYGDQVGDFAGLQLPRPEILRNAFVLWPLALLAPAVQHPQAGQSFAQLWEQAQISQRLWPVSFIWNGEELTPPALRQAFPAG
jgi:2-amino-4-hydroxy-6-hydroxymethyldihydropteridine diphosphokinase